MSSTISHPHHRQFWKKLLIPTLVPYDKAWIVFDVLAGVLLLVIALPEQIATARLAGMPPTTGLIAFIVATFMFVLLGTNPQMSIGADSTIAPLMLIGIARYAMPGTGLFIADMGILAVLVGILVALVGVLRFGWIANFLSDPIITGFLSGVGIIIIVHQLSDVFGVKSVSGSTVNRVVDIVKELGTMNWLTFLLAAGVFIVIIASETLNKRLPGALFGLVLSGVAVTVFGLASHGVAILGTVAAPTLTFGLTGLSVSTVISLLPLAAVIALVITSQSTATSRAFAQIGGYSPDFERDYFAIGAGSVVAGLVGAFPVDASPARTAAVSSAGGKSQATGIVAAVVMIAFLPIIGVLHNVPLATFAAILVFVATKLFHVGDFVKIFRFDKWEFALAIITFLTVALVGVEQGIGVAVGLAILDRTRMSARPKITVLGRKKGTTSWEIADPSRTDLEEVPDTLVALFPAPLYFANSEHFRTEFIALWDEQTPRPSRVVLDAAAMTDIDYTGTTALKECAEQFKKEGATLMLARPYPGVERELVSSGVLATLGKENLFGSVDDAAKQVVKP